MQKLKYLKLFEELNQLSSKKFAEKLHLYAEASTVSKKVTSIEERGGYYVFAIESSLPAENDLGEKTFIVSIPVKSVGDAVVSTYVNGSQIFSEKLEPAGENDINVILKNFIEAAQLYDDNVIEVLTAEHDNISTRDDIRKIVKNGNYSPEKTERPTANRDRD